MISYDVKKYEAGDSLFNFKGLSTDTKPTKSYANMDIANGSTFFEMDTQEVYFYDGGTDSWLAQP